MARNVVPNTGVETIGTPDKRWSAIYADKLYLADQDKLSSVSDGVADATPVLQDLLNLGGKVRVPAGTYRLTDTLIVPVYKTELQGERGTVFVADSSMNNKPVLQFVNDEAHTSYLKRRYTTGVHGGFVIDGSQSTDCIAMQIGDGNYSINCLTFHDIILEGAKTSLKLEAHNYKNVFSNIVSNSHSNTVYSLVSTATDSGEANTFIGCAFWAGAMLLNAPATYVGCTIHLSSGKIKASTTANCLFTGCHFEVLNYTTPNTEAFITAKNAFINIDNSEFIWTTKNYTMGYPLFEAITDASARSGSIQITDCSMEGWWDGLTKNDTNRSISVCKGNVIIRGCPHALFNDNSGFLNRVKSVYDYSNLTINRFADESKWVSASSDTAVGFSIENNVIEIASGNLNRYIKFALPSNARSVVIHCHYSSTNTCTFNLANANNGWQGLGFFDENDNFVKAMDIGDTFYTQTQTGFLGGTVIIPPTAKYLGLGFSTTGANTITVDTFGVEFI